MDRGGSGRKKVSAAGGIFHGGTVGPAGRGRRFAGRQERFAISSRKYLS